MHSDLLETLHVQHMQLVQFSEAIAHPLNMRTEDRVSEMLDEGYETPKPRFNVKSGILYWPLYLRGWSRDNDADFKKFATESFPQTKIQFLSPFSQMVQLKGEGPNVIFTKGYND